ncbi:MAG TPA: histidine kinase [Chitinophaga sp.]|uniref:sensor histidine kinase n=1 Tax=Chitinophaga sp. TaxID=1869181 RepID=UPI002DBB571C|nr:histidine kinase [Chitinophaga sp.]HEU4555521.1 histidine kinase [Chitinophaga sp.]
MNMPYLNVLKNKKFIFYHILAWLIYILFAAINQLALGRMAAFNLPDLIVTYLPSIYVFYGSTFILFRFFSRKNKGLFILSEVLFFISYVFFSYFVYYIIGPLVRDPSEPHVPFKLGNFLLSGMWLFFIYSYFSIGYYFARRTIQREKELRVIEREKLQADQGKLEAEYAFLRAQINPHFLHNTLNFFYAKSLGYSKELSEGILTLCEIMRYSLSSGEDEQGTVLLSKEVEHLQNVMNINQLRFSNRLQIDFTVTGDSGHLRIVPLVLITLVENAFKHGDLVNKENPLVIKLLADMEKQYIYFSIHNKKKKGPKELSHGIGMDNIRKRLAASYTTHFSLDITDEPEFYTVVLTIDLAAVKGNQLVTTLAAAAVH